MGKVTINVIYIEDEDAEALLFKLGLGQRGIEVLHLPDAMPNSLKTLQTPLYQAASAIFFDMWVGGMNGLELGKALRAAGDNRPFFLVTASPNPDQHLLQELQIRYLRKPLNFGEVGDMLLALQR